MTNTILQSSYPLYQNIYRAFKNKSSVFPLTNRNNRVLQGVTMSQNNSRHMKGFLVVLETFSPIPGKCWAYFEILGTPGNVSWYDGKFFIVEYFP
jgi:hypothetical protein